MSQYKSDETQASPFRGWLIVFILFHALLSIILIYNGIITVAAYLKSGNYLGLLLAGYFFLPASVICLLLKKKTLFRVFYILYAVFFFLTTLDPSNFAQTAGAGLITTALLAGPWLVYIFRSKRVAALFDAHVSNGDATEI